MQMTESSIYNPIILYKYMVDYVGRFDVTSNIFSNGFHCPCYINIFNQLLINEAISYN